MTAIDTLQEMLMYRRPADSKTERKFIGRYIEPLGVIRDTYGNLIKRIGTAPVLWSCHTDTVHRDGGKQPIERAGDILGLVNKSRNYLGTRGSNCLGADDTAGVWLMCELIRAKKEGLYIFHRAEERGGCGSSYIAKHTPAALDGIKYAIALDRRGTTNVITHQFQRCCSDEFAASLAAGLNDRTGLHYRGDDGGIFTDTANYTDLVGECTNLSVGYTGEHSSGELQDGAHCAALKEALIDLDLDALVASRKAGEKGDYGWSSYGWATDKKGGYAPYGEHAVYSAASSKGGPSRASVGKDWSSYLEGNETVEELERMSMHDVVAAYPEETASYLEEMGVDERELTDYIKTAYGM